MRSSSPKARERLNAIIEGGQIPIGGFVTSIDPMVTALFGYVGYDFVIIDGEHGIFGPRDVFGHVQAAAGSGTIPLVRLPANTRVGIQQALDMGAGGVVIPKAQSAADMSAAVHGSKYVPGGRGFCPSVPAAGWTREDWNQFSSSSDMNAVVIPLIETKAGVDAIAEIASVDGVEFVFFGVADLSQDLGIDLDADRDIVLEMWRTVRDAVHAVNKKVGGPLGFQLDGADFGTGPGDLGSLRGALGTQLRDLRARFGTQVEEKKN